MIPTPRSSVKGGRTASSGRLANRPHGKGPRSVKRVLSVGQCLAEHTSIAWTLRSKHSQDTTSVPDRNLNVRLPEDGRVGKCPAAFHEGTPVRDPSLREKAPDTRILDLHDAYHWVMMAPEADP